MDGSAEMSGTPHFMAIKNIRTMMPHQLGFQFFSRQLKIAMLITNKTWKHLVTMMYPSKQRFYDGHFEVLLLKPTVFSSRSAGT